NAWRRSRRSISSGGSDSGTLGLLGLRAPSDGASRARGGYRVVCPGSNSQPRRTTRTRTLDARRVAARPAALVAESHAVCGLPVRERVLDLGGEVDDILRAVEVDHVALAAAHGLELCDV